MLLTMPYHSYITNNTNNITILVILTSTIPIQNISFLCENKNKKKQKKQKKKQNKKQKKVSPAYSCQ